MTFSLSFLVALKHLGKGSLCKSKCIMCSQLSNPLPLKKLKFKRYFYIQLIFYASVNHLGIQIMALSKVGTFYNMLTKHFLIDLFSLCDENIL